jgi:hypothetical protein
MERARLAYDVVSAAVDIVHEFPEWAHLRGEPGFRIVRDRIWRDDLDSSQAMERPRVLNVGAGEVWASVD